MKERVREINIGKDFLSTKLEELRITRKIVFKNITINPPHIAMSGFYLVDIDNLLT